MKNYKNERAEARKKARELVSKMTLMEKASQLNMTHHLWIVWGFLLTITGTRLYMV